MAGHRRAPSGPRSPTPAKLAFACASQGASQMHSATAIPRRCRPSRRARADETRRGMAAVVGEPLRAEPWSTVASVVGGGILIVAGGVVAAVNSAAPFAHGSWLAAYLVLVGGVAQIALAAGHAALVAPGRGSRRPRSRLLLWNFGSLAVPAGVPADSAAWVTAGSVALLCALALFARVVSDAPRSRTIAYLALVVSLGASVVVGSALADAAPGGWL